MSVRLFVAAEIFAWIFLAIALFYLAGWPFDRSNNLRHEYLIGSAMAWVYGSPFWLGALALAVWKRRELSRSQKLRDVAIFVAVLLIFASQFVGG